MFKQNTAYSKTHTDHFFSDKISIQNSVPWSNFVCLWQGVARSFQGVVHESVQQGSSAQHPYLQHQTLPWMNRFLTKCSKILLLFYKFSFVLSRKTFTYFLNVHPICSSFE
jgi:hypothetical protein